MAADALEELLLLCQAAAEAGEDWRRRLAREWLPSTLARNEAGLRAALASWRGHVPESREALESAALAALDEAMDQAGYR
ncbi:MAG: hypothetical protein ACP5NF_07510 [Thermoanaerobaculum sp.]